MNFLHVISLLVNFEPNLHISLIQYQSRKLENHICQHNLSRFQKDLFGGWGPSDFLKRFFAMFFEILSYLNSNGLLSKSTHSQLAFLKKVWPFEINFLENYFLIVPHTVKSVVRGEPTSARDIFRRLRISFRDLSRE